MRKIVISSVLALAVLALVPSVANADAVVRIRSDQPANAYLDGKLAGSTPIVLSKLKSGSHVLKIENAESGEVKIFNVYSPAGATAEKDVDVAWDTSPGIGEPVAQQPARTTEVVRTTVVQPTPVYVQQPVPVVYAPVRQVYGRPVYGPPAAPYPRSYRGSRYDSQRYQEERDKVRSRNVLLGAAAANEILNKGSSKGTVRGVTLGGALLNEVLRSGQ